MREAEERRGGRKIFARVALTRLLQFSSLPSGQFQINNQVWNANRTDITTYVGSYELWTLVNSDSQIHVRSPLSIRSGFL